MAELDEHEHWVGKIKELRAHKNAKESLDVLSIPLTFSIPPINNDKVWARVQWYWSGEDVAQLIKSLYCTSQYFP